MPIPVSKQAEAQKLFETLEKTVSCIKTLQSLETNILDDAQTVRLKAMIKELDDMQCVAMARARKRGRLTADLMRISKLPAGKASDALKRGLMLLKKADAAARAAAEAKVTEDRAKRQADREKINNAVRRLNGLPAKETTTDGS